MNEDKSADTKTFKEYLDKRKIKYDESSGSIVITSKNGALSISQIFNLPDGLRFENKGTVEIDSVTSLGSTVTFANIGDVHLRDLQKIPRGYRFENKGAVTLQGIEI